MNSSYIFELLFRYYNVIDHWDDCVTVGWCDCRCDTAATEAQTNSAACEM